MRDVLEPFAIATHILQASHTRLDHVLTTLGTLHHEFSNPSWRVRKLDMLSDRAIQTISTRFARAEQAIFIFAVFVNPWLRADIFEGGAITLQRLYTIALQLCRRFYHTNDEEVGPDFVRAFTDYYLRRGDFVDGEDGMGLDVARVLYGNVRD
jgi:hypothetical protein